MNPQADACIRSMHVCHHFTGSQGSIIVVLLIAAVIAAFSFGLRKK